LQPGYARCQILGYPTRSDWEGSYQYGVGLSIGMPPSCGVGSTADWSYTNAFANAQSKGG